MVRTPNIATMPYQPGPVPTDPAQIPQYLENEFTKIASAVQQLQLGHVDMINVAPLKPRTGDIRCADGTNFNPGSGIGFYGYYGAAWHFLG